MLGLVLIYWIGKQFYELAELHNKHQWLHAILGVVIFYSVQIVFGILVATIIDIGSLESSAEIGFNLTGVFAGGVGVYIYYVLLGKYWDQRKPIRMTDILDDDLDDLL